MLVLHLPGQDSTHVTIYDKFISPTRRPSFLLKLQLTSVLQTTASNQAGTSELPPTHSQAGLRQVNRHTRPQRGKRKPALFKGVRVLVIKTKPDGLKDIQHRQRHTTWAGCPILNK